MINILKKYSKIFLKTTVTVLFNNAFYQMLSDSNFLVRVPGPYQKEMVDEIKRRSIRFSNKTKVTNNCFIRVK